MNRNIILLIFIAITAIIIVTATVINQKENKVAKPTIEEVLDNYDKGILETAESSNMDQIKINEVVDAFLESIEKSEDKKHDRDYYLKVVQPEFEKLFKDLNDSTYILVDDMIEGSVKDIDAEINTILQKEKKVTALIEDAISKSRNKDFILFYRSVIKYNKIQNTIITETADIYKSNHKINERVLNEIFMDHMNTVSIDDYISLEILSKIK